MPKKQKLNLKVGIQTYQILTNNDGVCIPSLSSILIAVPCTQLESQQDINKFVPLPSSAQCSKMGKKFNAYFSQINLVSLSRVFSQSPPIFIFQTATYDIYPHMTSLVRLRGTLVMVMRIKNDLKNITTRYFKNRHASQK